MKHLHTYILTHLLVTLFLAACASAATGATTSGVYGQATIGPMCPVERPGVPCPDKPYQGQIAVLDSNRNPVTKFETDAQGNFKIGLKPGTYFLVSASPNGYPFAQEQAVTVTAGLFTRVSLQFDSGIR